MQVIIRFLQDTGFYKFTQGMNWQMLIMILISLVLVYLAIVKKFEPLLLLNIAIGMLLTNLPGTDMFHEILFAGGHVHWDLFGGAPVTAAFIEEMRAAGVAESLLATIQAGDVIKTVTALCGGKGGGKPDSAMGGGTDLLKLDDALAAVDDFVSVKLGL